MEQVLKDKISTGVWSAIGGTILTMIIGFNFGGWVTGGTSVSMSTDAAQAAIVERLTPICVAQFNQDPNRDDKLKKFKASDSWNRDSYVKKQGWATMPFEKEPDSRVADSCSELIMKNNS